MPEIEYKYFATCRNEHGWTKKYEIRCDPKEIKLLDQLQEYGEPVGILLWSKDYDESFTEGDAWCSLIYNEKLFNDSQMFSAGFLKIISVEKVEIKKVKTVKTIYNESNFKTL